MRADLPADTRQELSYAATVDALRALEGEEVCLFLAGGGEGATVSRIQASGPLRHYEYGWGEGFAIGDGVRVLLAETDFEGGQLRTCDGVDFFSVSVRLVGLSFVIGDPASLETDEFDLVP